MRPEDLVRQAFEAKASQVEVSPDALPKIRARIAGRRRRSGVGLTGLATALTATAAAVVIGIVSCVPPQSATPPPIGGQSTPPSLAPVGADRVPVYFVGNAGRLYREYHVVSATDLSALVRQALGIMLGGQNRDPDYHSAWPASTKVTAVRINEGIAEVQLSDGTAADQPIAQQQLVWTVTGVAADTGVQLQGVRINGGPALIRASSGDVLAPVWLIAPEEGETVSATFDVHVSGRSDLTVMLAVRDGVGGLVDTRPVSLSAGAFAFGDEFLRLSLAPGRYTLEVYYLSGGAGSPQGMDAHNITVG